MAGHHSPLSPELRERRGARNEPGTSRGAPSRAGQGTSILRTQEATVGAAGGGGEREAAVTLQRAILFSGQDPPRGLEEVTR